jgi:hypothetical protein
MRSRQNLDGHLALRLRLSGGMKRIEFPRWSLVVGTVLLVIWMGALVVGLVGIYIADEYATPAFSEQSFPQPRLY